MMSRASRRTTLNPPAQALITSPRELTRRSLRKWFLSLKDQLLMKALLWYKYLSPKGSLRMWLLRNGRLLANLSVWWKAVVMFERVSCHVAESCRCQSLCFLRHSYSGYLASISPLRPCVQCRFGETPNTFPNVTSGRFPWVEMISASSTRRRLQHKTDELTTRKMQGLRIAVETDGADGYLGPPTAGQIRTT